MNRIDVKFRELKRRDKKAFIAYVTAGDPDIAVTEKIVLALERSGVDIVELGIPFSDPVADGPTIQAASQRALKRGANLVKIFALVRRLRNSTEIPLVFMTYYNPVLSYGIKRFFDSCRNCGVDGIIVPDLPPEEAGDLIRYARIAKVATIFLTAPTSTTIRIKKITDRCRGFVYHVSLTGVTGARSKLPSEVIEKVKQIKAVTDKPIAVGFGVSSPKEARRISGFADGVIVGSAIIKVLDASRYPASSIYKFSKKIAMAIHA